jgi:hypothetical protein
MAEEAGYSSAAWDMLASECARLKKLADEGGVAARAAAEGFEGLRKEADDLFGALMAMSDGVVADLRKAAGVPDLGDAVKVYADATKRHAQLMQALDWASTKLGTLGRALRTGTKLGDTEDDTTYGSSRGPGDFPVRTGPRDPAEAVPV